MKKLNLILSSLIFILFLISSSTSFSADVKIIKGIAEVVDGDTIKIDGTRIRLFGIDAPEKDQTCKKNYFNHYWGKTFPLNLFYKDYNCGIHSTWELKALLSHDWRSFEDENDYLGKKFIITCTYKTRDKWGRPLAICTHPRMGYFTDYHAKSLNQWMVKWGYAVAFTKYSKKYVSDEKTAKSFKIGIWKGPFEMPWDFREKKRKKKKKNK
jgi:endonuclease YncB( thermonuclease family)